jgi:hypothetical protein
MLFWKKKIVVLCENRTKHTNTLCGQNADVRYVKAGVTYGTAGYWRVKYSQSELIKLFSLIVSIENIRKLYNFLGFSDVSVC